MKRLRSALVVAVAIIATRGLTAASAQSAIPTLSYVRDSSGQVFVVSAGQRYGIPIYPATDEQIAAIPFNDLWLVPNADGTAYANSPKPEWAVGAAPAPVAAPPPPPAAPGGNSINLNGGASQNTRPFDLAAGNYTVKWSGSMRGQFGGNLIMSLKRVDGPSYGGELIVNIVLGREKPHASGETQVYSVKAGQHYMDVTSPAAWAVEIRPQ